MIEPTETETKERLDHFADVVRAILEEAAEDPEIARNAPYTTPVRRLDEAGAAKRPVVRWRPTQRTRRSGARADAAAGGTERCSGHRADRHRRG